MAGATVIDQLIVKLGLDPRDFTKGQKQVAQEMVKTEGVVKKSSDSMGRSMLGFSAKVFGVATAAIAVKKAISYVADLSVSVRQLGIDSRNFGIAASEMKNFQNIGEMMGGKAEEVTKTIGSITKAVYDLAYNGQISDSLIMLGRLGVQFQDTAGNARDFKDIVLDTEAAIQKSMKHGTSYANANQLLLQAGFDPGLAKAMLEGNVRQQLAKQEGRRQVTGESVSSATAWEQSATSSAQALEAGSLRGLPAAAKAGVATNEGIEAAANYASTATFKGTLNDIGEALNTAGEKIKKGADSLVDALETVGGRAWRGIQPKGREAHENSIQHWAAKEGVDPEMLASVLATESNFDPSAFNPKSGAVGIAQLMPKFFPGAGENPDADIHSAAKLLRTLYDDARARGFTGDDLDVVALRGYNAGRTRVKNSMDGTGKPLAQETLDYPGKVLGYAAGAVPTPNAQGGKGEVNNTEVNIAKVDVVTQATNADGIAKDFVDATKRKMNAAQADKGMQ